ncbi:MAG: hypothetical protein EB060_01640 [Proteobacteria bacterium]|nr:hypothetical protein [Pseudomonadota bacterium]
MQIRPFVQPFYGPRILYPETAMAFAGSSIGLHVKDYFAIDEAEFSRSLLVLNHDEIHPEGFRAAVNHTLRHRVPLMNDYFTHYVDNAVDLALLKAIFSDPELRDDVAEFKGLGDDAFNIGFGNLARRLGNTGLRYEQMLKDITEQVGEEGVRSVLEMPSVTQDGITLADDLLLIARENLKREFSSIFGDVPMRMDRPHNPNLSMAAQRMYLTYEECGPMTTRELADDSVRLISEPLENIQQLRVLWENSIYMGLAVWAGKSADAPLEEVLKDKRFERQRRITTQQDVRLLDQFRTAYRNTESEIPPEQFALAMLYGAHIHVDDRFLQYLNRDIWAPRAHFNMAFDVMTFGVNQVLRPDFADSVRHEHDHFALKKVGQTDAHAVRMALFGDGNGQEYQRWIEQVRLHGKREYGGYPVHALPIEAMAEIGAAAFHARRTIVRENPAITIDGLEEELDKRMAGVGPLWEARKAIDDEIKATVVAMYSKRFGPEEGRKLATVLGTSDTTMKSWLDHVRSKNDGPSKLPGK